MGRQEPTTITEKTMFVRNQISRRISTKRSVSRTNITHRARPTKAPVFEELERREMMSATALQPITTRATALNLKTVIYNPPVIALPPTAPTFSVAAQSSSQVKLAWSPAARANGYLVDEWVSGAWKQIANFNSSILGCTVSGLSASTTYYFDVAAYNLSGTTWANFQSVTTSPQINNPAAATGYSNVAGSLFSSSGPSFLDVNQGAVGDCWLLSSLAEVADRDPSDIRNMFTSAGSAMENGSMVSLYSVRLFSNSGVAEHILVDTELPSGGGYYDHPANGALWVALAEKAYAEANGLGYVTTGHMNSNSYAALNDGDAVWALHAITGKPASDYYMNTGNIASAWNSGKLVVLCTNTPSSSYIVPSHCYAMVAYNSSSTMPFEVYNPWGTNSSGWALGTYNGHAVYGLFNANATFISQNFNLQSFGIGTALGTDNQVSDSLETTSSSNGNLFADDRKLFESATSRRLAARLC
jgi:Calpain family cysteine protease